MAIIQRGGDIHKNTMKDFIEQFKCYRLDHGSQIDESLVHRIEEYKEFKKIYTFEKLDFLEELETDFEEKFLGYVGKY
jgi:ABC-2 type transport system ATP-binding protein